jgi:uncharacterized protein YaiI (UPF0178 family)
MRILVDGDSSGHRDLLIAIVREFDLELVWVCNHASRPPWPEEGLKLTVRHMDVDAQAADMELMNLSRPGDIVITGDLGLASVCVVRGAAALSPRGFWFKEDHLLERLEFRALAARLRRGGVNLEHKPPHRRLDDHRFELELRRAIEAGLEPA